MSTLTDRIFGLLPADGRPSPSELDRPIPIDFVAQHRALNCLFYADCLDRACNEGWQSWSCSGCTIGGLPPAKLPEAPEDEAAPPRSARVLEVLHGAPRKWTPEQLADELGLDDPGAISNDLGKLVQRGAAMRVGQGEFGRPGLEPAPAPPRAPSLWARALEVIAAGDRVWTAPELAGRLEEDNTGRVANALRDLAHEGKIRRVARGFYARQKGETR
ncbi:hypothetical protein [Vulgatibacter sp.]|uniref:hypothetical protein n=1 Tax=Vulgatibacter sp. TaxID=1971226 RepID=UPI0035678DF3